ncbi:MAG: peptidase [Legionellales bacterium RIFCSPHIGHO2_12_FULL_35_11]|nr:MAG: peptidase [Legionellales bacterium RIFCSPHIGHO2_12_FULL_35_11]
MKKNTYFWRKGLWALCSLFFLFLFCVSLLYVYTESQLPNVESLKTVKLQVPLRIYTEDGFLIQEYGEKRRIPLAFYEIPKTLVYALLATEDQRFFEHPGVDVFGLGRAAIRMMQTGTKSQGGSTITMQVARNFFLNRKKTFLRKFNEIMLAIKIDRELSKEKILELYLNQIYLGNRAYGVGAAAKIYYGKNLNQLTVAELAMIAGLPQAPSTHNPIINPKAAKIRRDHVLDRLYEEKYIDKTTYEEAKNEAVTAKYHGTKIEVSAPYVAEMIRQSLFDHFGPDAYTNGYKVYTTIDSKLQVAADDIIEENLLAYDVRHGYRGRAAGMPVEDINSSAARKRFLQSYLVIKDIAPVVIKSVSDSSATALFMKGKTIDIPWAGMSWARPALSKGGYVGRSPKSAHAILSPGDIVYVRHHNGIWELTQDPKAEAALVAISPNNGAIKALVGGFNFKRSKFNRVTQSSRQPGSSFKPFIFAAALNKGYTLATLVNDAPVVINDPSQVDNVWRPHNDKYKFNGPTRLRVALARSINLVSIRILQDIGIDYAIDFASRFGFKKTSLPRTLSLALGSLAVSPMDLTAAYAVFANGGYKVEPFLIDKITDSSDNVLLKAKASAVCHNCTDAQVDIHAPRVISEDIAFLMNNVLKDVILHGTGTYAKVLNRSDIAGKTGTTNQQVDAWFSGYNPDLAVTAWVGFDSPKPLHEYASRLALPIWIDFMKIALHDKPDREVVLPENIVPIDINPKTGLRAQKNQTNVIKEYFLDTNIPELDEGEVLTQTGSGKKADSQESLF